MRAMYSGWDVQYLPLVAAIAQGNLGEPMLLESRGQGWHAFPIASLIPHAAGYSLLGANGLLLVDLLLPIAMFLAFRLLAREVGLEPIWASVAAFAVATFALEPITRTLSQDFLGYLGLWGRRAPRPFVSELYLVLALAAAFAIRNRPMGQRNGYLVLLGLSLAGVVHSDFHASLTMILFSGALWLTGCQDALKDGQPRLPRLGRELAWLVLPATPFAIAYLAQRLATPPEIAQRFGVFSVPRFPPFWDEYGLGTSMLVAGALLVGAVVLILLGPRNERGKRAAGWLLILVLMANFAVPLYSMLLGQLVQPTQFADRTQRLGLLGNWLVGLLLIQSLLTWLLGPRFARRAAVAALVLVLATAIGQIYWWAPRVLRLELPTRKEFAGDEYRPLFRTYRTDFHQLIDFLNRATGPDDVVIGTFDHQAAMWWLTFRDGSSFAADPFLSVAPAPEIEDRLILLAREMGFSRDGFEALIQRWYIKNLWLGCQKYMANQWTTFAPREEYSEEVRAKIDRLPYFLVWELELPPSERERLLARYDALEDSGESPYRLDFLVVSRDEGMLPASPDPARWTQVFENPSYRVFFRTEKRNQ